MDQDQGSVRVGDPRAARLMESLDDLLARASDPQLSVGSYVPAIQFSHLLELTSGRGLGMEGKRVLDFGCGAQRPFSGALLYYICGAAEILALDIEPIFDVGSVAVGVIAEIIDILFDESKFDFVKAGLTREAALRRLSVINLAALRRGELRSGLPSAIDWRTSYYNLLSPDERQFDIIISNTVFEHVSNVYETLSDLHRDMNPDGYLMVVIDYKDHRAYAGTTKSWFQYLMDGGDYRPGYINKVRHSEFVRIASMAGFEVENCVLETIHPTPEERSKFLPEFSGLSDLDISTSGARILFRPAKTRISLSGA